MCDDDVEFECVFGCVCKVFGFVVVVDNMYGVVMYEFVCVGGDVLVGEIIWFECDMVMI